ncbi:hypothetical protein IW262DRAFT_1486458 [Armillaria fumosa]|nr:hypothetical protein IW262DRAFT_1486458 [Armillaria fumosa]
MGWDQVELLQLSYVTSAYVVMNGTRRQDQLALRAVSTICQSWGSLGINESCLWTSLAVTIAAAINRLPVPADEIFDFFEVFLKVCTILERDFDFYFYLGEKWEHWEGREALKSFNEVRLVALFDLLAWHVHRMRSFDVSMLTWELVVHLCSQIHGIAMPRLDTWNFEHTYGQGLRYDVEPIHVLECDDLQGSRRSLRPALEYVRCSGIPLNWELFSPSNLQTLRLEYQPRDERLSMETLRGILWNGKDTLEHLELTDVLGIHAEAPVPDARLVLQPVTCLVLVYTGLDDAWAVLQGFEVPELRTLVVRSPGGFRSDDVLKYIEVEDLLDVKLAYISVDCSEGDAGGTAEESIPLIYQLFRRFSRGNLHRLTLDHCCEGFFLKFMNYGNEIGGGSVNLSQLKALIVRVWTRAESEGIVSLLRGRLELGSVDGSRMLDRCWNS